LRPAVRECHPLPEAFIVYCYTAVTSLLESFRRSFAHKGWRSSSPASRVHARCWAPAEKSRVISARRRSGDAGQERQSEQRGSMVFVINHPDCVVQSGYAASHSPKDDLTQA